MKNILINLGVENLGKIIGLIIGLTVGILFMLGGFCKWPWILCLIRGRDIYGLTVNRILAVIGGLSIIVVIIGYLFM